MTDKPLLFKSPRTPTVAEGSIESITRDLRKQDGDLRVQGERIAALIAKEPFLATKEWVYVSFLKYIVPSMLLLIGVLFAYLVKFNESLMREVIRAIAKSS